MRKRERERERGENERERERERQKEREREREKERETEREPERNLNIYTNRLINGEIDWQIVSNLHHLSEIYRVENQKIGEESQNERGIMRGTRVEAKFQFSHIVN